MEYGEQIGIFVVEIAGAAGKSPMGIVVDSVSETLSIKAGDMEDTPDFGSRPDTDYILGMAESAHMEKYFSTSTRIEQ